jgi:hypothetical protein
MLKSDPRVVDDRIIRRDTHSAILPGWGDTPGAAWAGSADRPRYPIRRERLETPAHMADTRSNIDAATCRHLQGPLLYDKLLLRISP